MKIAAANLMVPGKSITEQAENLANWGFDGIALFIKYSEWNDALHQEIINLEKNTGIKPCEFAFGDELYGHLMSDDLKLRKESREMYKLAARIAGELGAVTELEFAYGVQDPLPLFNPYQQMSSTQHIGFLDMYRELTQPLTGTGGSMLLEGINRYESPYLNSIKECKDIIDELSLANTGVLADFFHMSIEESNIADSIRYAGSDIKHVHLGDNNRLLPGYGAIDWQAGFNALKDVGYEGFVCLECSTCGDAASTLPETAKFLRKLIK
ncbi:TPA: TIM barrel protein [Providencia rettgeri]